MLTPRPELPAVAEAMCRILAEALMGESPATMTREVETIVGEWWGETGIDHFEIEWRLAALRSELASCIEAGRKPPQAFADRDPLALKRALALKRLAVAHEVVCRSRVQSLV